VLQAPTGAGKTESFLLPVLRDLWQTPRVGVDGGMRCLVLYPMNALVSDQVERIYRWLQGQNRLTVFHFTSETPEDKREANGQGEPSWEACRPRTRQQARGFINRRGEVEPEYPRRTVPDIVVTNYSMLRPGASLNRSRRGASLLGSARGRDRFTSSTGPHPLRS